VTKDTTRETREKGAYKSGTPAETMSGQKAKESLRGRIRVAFEGGGVKKEGRF